MLYLIVALSCVKRTVVRDAPAYATEQAASLARQTEAADALLAAAELAREAGDVSACGYFAEPALLIKATARVQAHRALWLAGLPYPAADGTVPPVGTAQADPGPAPSPTDVSTICEED